MPYKLEPQDGVKIVAIYPDYKTENNIVLISIKKETLKEWVELPGIEVQFSLPIPMKDNA